MSARTHCLSYQARSHPLHCHVQRGAGCNQSNYRCAITSPTWHLVSTNDFADLPQIMNEFHAQLCAHVASPTMGLEMNALLQTSCLCQSFVRACVHVCVHFCSLSRSCLMRRRKERERTG